MGTPPFFGTGGGIPRAPGIPESLVVPVVQGSPSAGLANLESTELRKLSPC